MPHADTRTARATALIALSACGFGSISVLTTLVARAGTPLVPAMFWRFLLAVVLLGGLVALRRAQGKLVAHVSVPLLLAGGIGQALITYLSLRALDYIPVAPLAFLFYTYPAWVAIVSAVRRVDRITPVRAVALVIALLGVSVIVGPPVGSGHAASLHPMGIALALASAIAYGVYLPAVSTLQRGIEPMVAALHVIAGATVTFAIGALLRGEIAAPVTLVGAAGIGTLALVSTVGAFWLLLAGLAILGPVRTAIVATVEPFFTMLLGAVVLHDMLNVRTGLGGALIALAVIVIQRAPNTHVLGQATAPGVTTE
ncbi:MAG TPA: DMT family transporter [Candidatus Elarobacter sp.]|nr:DMT family transporter [Candidatus Elarobacter sp.]